MSDFLGALATRAVQAAQAVPSPVQPRLSGRFEPSMPGADPSGQDLERSGDAPERAASRLPEPGLLPPPTELDAPAPVGPATDRSGDTSNSGPTPSAPERARAGGEASSLELPAPDARVSPSPAPMPSAREPERMDATRTEFVVHEHRWTRQERPANPERVVAARAPLMPAPPPPPDRAPRTEEPSATQRSIAPVIAQPHVAAPRARAGSRPALAPEPAPSIRVTIGRIDVRAIAPAAPAPAVRQPAQPAPATLEDYLRSRERSSG